MPLILYLAFAIAGFAVIWRKLKRGHPALRAAIARIPEPFQTAIRCTTCFSYWLSLLATVLFEPLANALPGIAGIVVGWFALAFLSVTLRYVCDYLGILAKPSHGHAAHAHD